jgi:hypothetical protein
MARRPKNEAGFIANTSRLTPEEFKGIAKARGYTLAEVAQAWGLTPTRVSQIANDPDRDPRDEYALWGLPTKQTAAAVVRQRQRLARQYAKPSRHRSGPPPLAPKDIWDELTAVGSVFRVAAEQGDHLPADCEGVVVAREHQAGELHVSMRFTTGYSESYPLSFLKDPACFLVATGSTK